MKVLVTGATGGFGKLLVRRLESDPAVTHIIGLGNEQIDEGLEDYIEDEKFQFQTGDIRNKRVEEIFQRNPGIDVLVHLAYDNDPEHSSSEVEETNVFGTLRMIRLARKYGVKKFIYKGPTAVYGARSDNPSLIKEDFPLRGNRNSPSVRNKIEADMTCQMNMHPGILPKICILRFCGVIGRNVRSPLNTLFKTVLVPMVSGFDPMFQIIHERDVTEALALAVINTEAEGVFNVAGRYTEPLSQVIHRMGRMPFAVPEPVIDRYYKTYFMGRTRHSFPFDLNYIKHPFAVDTTRAREVLGFKPLVL